MFPFARDSKNSEPATEGSQTPPPATPQAHPLDALTRGVFSAATSGERAQRVRDWLATDPRVEDMQAVYKELSAKDRGAARALRDRLEELRRAKAQEAIADEWRVKGQALLDAARLHIADALAWQRDAAQAGAPLAREPLSGIRDRLTQRVKAVEDLQQRVMVQREAAALLAQRIELLSTHSWVEAKEQQAGLDRDIAAWRETSTALVAEPDWSSVELRYPPQLEQAEQQLGTVWTALAAALQEAEAAATDPQAPLPSVQVWAEELRQARAPADAPAAKPAKVVDPEARKAANGAVEAGAKLLEQAVAAGHTKDMHGAVQALRRLLKVHGALIDEALVARVHQTLISAGELQGWQRWSADQLREQLVARAEALLRPRAKREGKQASKAAAVDRAVDAPVASPSEAAPEATASEGGDVAAQSTGEVAPQAAVGGDAPVALQPVEASADVAQPGESAAAEPGEATPVAPESSDAPAEEPVAAQESAATQAEGEVEVAPSQGAAAPDRVPVLRGRKLQDEIRKLREEWKTADRGGAPNQALWHRFDRACTAAYKFVEMWLEQVRAQEAQAIEERTALIAEVNAWTAAQAGEGKADWKIAGRQLHRFSERWRAGGHVGEKAYGKLQPQWKAAIKAAEAPFTAAQKDNRAQRHALIAEAEALGAAPELHIDAIKDLQRRWQEEARAVPLPRKIEQKLWDAFRKPLDEAFQRRSAQRDAQRAQLGAHDRAVLEASKALEAAIAGGDAAQIRAAMDSLEAVSRGQVVEPAAANAPQGAEQAQAAASTGNAPEAAPGAAATASGVTASENAAPAPQEVATEPAADAPVSAEVTPVASDAATGDAAPQVAAATPTPEEPRAKPVAPKRVVAVRGDDRPNGHAHERDAGHRGDDRRGRGDRRFDDRRGSDRRGGDRRDDRRRGPDSRPPYEDRGPRLGQAAFRAQRDAASHAQAALRELAARAHGEAVVALLGAWQARDAAQVPSAKDLGRAVTPAIHGAWTQAITKAGGSAAQTTAALLRLEVAADIPPAAAQLEARRAMQLQLLVHRNDPAPAQTWGQDAAQVLAADYAEGDAHRLRAALKVLLRRG